MTELRGRSRVWGIAPLLWLSGCAIGPNYQLRWSGYAAAVLGCGSECGQFGEVPRRHRAGRSVQRPRADRASEDRAQPEPRYRDCRRARDGRARAVWDYAVGDLPGARRHGGVAAERTSSVGSFTFIPKGLNLSATYTQSGLSLSWEADVWGRLRRLTEAARAQYLASEEGKHAGDRDGGGRPDHRLSEPARAR